MIRNHRGWQLFGLLLGLLLSAPLHADEFWISAVETRLTEQVYVMDARFEYRFTKRVQEALNNGVPITLRLDIEVQRERNWLPDETIATLEQSYQLRYHALSHQYQVQNINSGAAYVFSTWDAAINSVSSLRNFPLLDANLIEAGELYQVELRIELDGKSLPTPLRLISYVTPDWHLSSDWSSWPLMH